MSLVVAGRGCLVAEVLPLLELIFYSSRNLSQIDSKKLFLFQWLSQPPSMGYEAPVTISACGEASHVASEAISSGSTRLLIMLWVIIVSDRCL